MNTYTVKIQMPDAFPPDSSKAWHISQPFVAAVADDHHAWLPNGETEATYTMLDSPFSLLYQAQVMSQFSRWFESDERQWQGTEWDVLQKFGPEGPDVLEQLHIYGFWENPDAATLGCPFDNEGPITCWGWFTDDEGTIALFVTQGFGSSEEPTSMVLFW